MNLNMNNVLKNITGIFLLTLSLFSWSNSKDQQAIDNALNTLESFMDTFNSKDMKVWSETLNYPHVRLASGEVTVWDTKEDYAAIDIFDKLEASGWHHSAWVSREIILASENKVHISTVFQRYDKNNQPTNKYQSLYIVTKENGKWGVKARSSLAP